MLLGGSFAPGDFGAMVLVHGPDGWAPDAQLHLPAIDPGDIAFIAVAIDGDTAVLGARNLFGQINGAYVFVRSAPGVWSQETVPLPEDVTGDNFGVSVHISGERFIVGAAHNQDTGAAWIYERGSSGTWTPVLKLVPSNFPLSFGYAVRLDGSTPVVGAWADHDIAPFAGSAYVFGDIALPCPADLDADGAVGVNDFLALLEGWGTPGGDVDGDGTTGIQDFLLLLGAWGTCPT
jgi:hypothetical protein